LALAGHLLTSNSRRGMRSGAGLATGKIVRVKKSVGKGIKKCKASLCT
jgi:hypothetical protein